MLEQILWSNATRKQATLATVRIRVRRIVTASCDTAQTDALQGHKHDWSQPTQKQFSMNRLETSRWAVFTHCKFHASPLNPDRVWRNAYICCSLLSSYIKSINILQRTTVCHNHSKNVWKFSSRLTENVLHCVTKITTWCSFGKICKRMLRSLPRIQVATVSFPCSPPELNFLDPSSSCPWRVRRVSCSLILKMKLVPSSLPRSSYFPSSFWFIL